MSTGHREGRHEAAAGASGLAAELGGFFTARTVLLILGVFGLQLGFILSYVGAFHSPKPQRIPIAVVAPAQVSTQTVSALNRVPGRPVSASAAADVGAARMQIVRGEVDGALIVNPATATDDLLIASARGAALTAALQEGMTRIEASQQRRVSVTDTAPLQPGDGRGLTAFYTVVGWLVGGYLVAAILGVTLGSRADNTGGAVIRLGAMLAYAVLSGLGGAVIIDPVLHALTGHFLALAAIGAVLVFAAASVTMALQALLGVIGIGVTVLLFVVLGNPSAGGPYQGPLLPPFWRAIGGALPNGAGTAALRDTVYFNGHAIIAPLLVIAGWAATGVLVTVAATAGHARRAARHLDPDRRDTVTQAAPTGEQENPNPRPNPVTG